MADALASGRNAFARRAWRDAHAQLSAADARSPLAPEDLDRLATATFLLGREIESHDIWARAHQAFLARGEAARAARCAFWIGFTLMLRGEMAPASGWFARGQQVLEDGRLDCVERGFMLVPLAIQNLFGGDPSVAFDTFEQAGKIAERFGDPDLATVSRLGRGQALILIDKIVDGLALLDEAMVAVTADEVSPIIAGLVYCAVIDECRKCFDVQRAREWTVALSHWCESQPDLVPYRGQCLVHRAEIMQLGGAWSDAMNEAQRARDRLSELHQPAVANAFYLLAELHRLRGEFAEAEEGYREANQRGRAPQPGLAQLRLAQGDIDAAAAAVRRVLGEAHDKVTRSQVLPAAVEILLAPDDVSAARAAADELSMIAADIDAPLLHAVSAHARGSVLLAQGDARAALDVLRPAWTAWQSLEAPYDAARVRILIGLAYRTLGDEDSADMELDAARWVFSQLGAAPALAGVEKLSRKVPTGPPGGLTAREAQVLRLVASGKTNRAIAVELVISERTVARHVSNIFTKLGVPSRSAATAYAYQHDLV